MKEIEIPRVHIPKRGLYDLFLKEIATAMKMKPKEVEKLFDL